jgi:hypothetical protein
MPEHCAVDERLDQPLQHYQHSRQTQNCHCEKYLRVGRYLGQKLNYLTQHRRKRSDRVGTTAGLAVGPREW